MDEATCSCSDLHPGPGDRQSLFMADHMVPGHTPFHPYGNPPGRPDCPPAPGAPARVPCARAPPPIRTTPHHPLHHQQSRAADCRFPPGSGRALHRGNPPGQAQNNHGLPDQRRGRGCGWPTDMRGHQCPGRPLVLVPPHPHDLESDSTGHRRPDGLHPLQ